MKKVIFILLAFIAVFSLTSFLQGRSVPANKEIVFPFETSYKATQLAFKAVKKNDNALRNIYIKKAAALFDDQYQQYKHQEHNPPDESDYKKRFSLIDINNDGAYDLLYSGESGGEGNVVIIALNTSKGFKKVFAGYQNIEGVEFKDHKLYRLSIHDWGCCMDYLNFYSVFEVSYTNNIPLFKRVYFASAFHDTEMPTSLMAKPLHFEVVNDLYKMRLAPVIDDVTKNESATEGIVILKGNTIDTLVNGTKGRAIAEQTDATGRIWWFVEIDANNMSHHNLFYDQNKNDHAAKMRWISSRFVKVIKD